MSIHRKVARLSRLFTIHIMAMALLIGVVPFAFDARVDAADLTDRSIYIQNPFASATTSHQIGFNIISNTQYGTIEIEYCSNNPFPGTACDAPTGFDIASATITEQFGETGFSVHATTTANKMVLTRTPVGPSGVTPSQARFTFDDVVNPADGDQSYYIRIQTKSLSGGAGTVVDEGGLAFSINGGIGVTAFVPPYLTFCVAITIPTNSCTSASGNTINFGELRSSSTASGTSQMIAATNGTGGYVINMIGTTMTAGNKTIPPLSSLTPPQQGVSQFGMNLRANSAPSVGANPDGPGSGVAIGDYNVANNYVFRSGDPVATVGIPNDVTRYTTSYIVNIDPEQPGGVYATTISYIATATF